VEVAINAANTLYFLPSVLLAGHPFLSDGQRLQIHEILNRLFVRAHFGQGLDLYWSKRLNRAELDRWLADSLMPKIMQMYGYKTAAFVESCAEICAVIAGAADDERLACMSFGRVFGVAYQIMDDVRNFSRSPNWTKECGEDIAEGKLTFVIVRALKQSSLRDSERLRELLCSKTDRRSTDGLADGIRIIRDSGVLESCAEEARDMAQREWSALSNRLADSDAKTMLQMLTFRILEEALEP